MAHLKEALLRKESVDIGKLLKKLLTADVGAAAKRGVTGAKKGVKWIGDTFPSDKKVQRMENIAERLRTRVRGPLVDAMGLAHTPSDVKASRVIDSLVNNMDYRKGQVVDDQVFAAAKKREQQLGRALKDHEFFSIVDRVAPHSKRTMEVPGSYHRGALKKSLSDTILTGWLGSGRRLNPAEKQLLRPGSDRVAGNVLQLSDFLGKLKKAKLGNAARTGAVIGGSAGGAVGIGEAISKAMDKSKEKK